MAEIRHMFTKVVGVTMRNPDGVSRQKVVAACSPLEKLKLEHEDDNPADPNAVAVRRKNGQQLGYLRAEIAEEVVRRSKQGYRYGAYVTAITGGTKGKGSRGANLLLIIAEPGVTDRKVQKYANKLAVDPTIVDRQASPVARPKIGCLLKLIVVVLIILWVIWKVAR
jgi:hypothetical protein